MRHDCDVSPEELGPFLLGHLPEDEAERVRSAVQRCPVCSAEMASLEPVVVALSAASPPVLPEPGRDRVDEVVLHGVLATVARERRTSRRRRWALVAVAAVAAGLLALGGLLLTGVLGSRDDDGRRVELARGPVNGSALLVDAEQGTRIALEVAGLGPGRYGVWLEDRAGQRVSAGSFRPDANGWAHVDLQAGLPLQDTQAIGMTIAGGDDLLRADIADQGPG